MADLAPPPIYSREYLGRLASQDELLEAKRQLDASESSLEDALARLLADSAALAVPADRLATLQPALASLLGEARILHETVAERALVADRISSNVRLLDIEQSRVKDCIDRVACVSQVKSAIAALHKAVEAGDWEAATRCIQRARAIDPEVIKSAFAESIVPTPDVSDPPSIALDNFTTKLTETFLTSFQAAAAARDEPNTSRYFKLFPLLGPAASLAGLTAYSNFVATLLVPPSISSSTGLLQPVTSLVEQIARIVAQHQPAVDKHYGLGCMENVVVAQLNAELDRFAVNKLIPAWEEDRRPQKLTTECKMYKFSKLQDLLNPPPTVTGVGANLPASLQKFSASVRERASTPVPFAIASVSHLDPNLSVATQSDEEGPEPKIVDSMLTELSGLAGRWGVYRRFLWDRLRNDTPKDDTVLPTPKHTNGTRSAIGSEGSVEDDDNEMAVIRQSQLHLKIEQILEDWYLPMEEWYLRASIERAHANDEPDLTSFPLLSSALDDTFYMLKKVLSRLTLTANLPTFISGCEKITEVLQRDFGEVCRKRLEVLSSKNAVMTGKGEEKDKREKEMRDGFVVFLNDLDTAAQYTLRLLEEALESEALENAFFQQAYLKLAKTALESVRSAESHFRSILKAGFDSAFTILVRPKLRSLISDCYKNVSYVLDDDQFTEAEFHDVVRKRFVKAWEQLLENYRESFTPFNFQAYFSTLVNVLVRPYETHIRTLRFNALGAIRFDRDLRSIMAYLSSQTSFGVGVLREGFTRLQQIAMLLELDPESGDDVEDFVASSEMSWRLSGQEIRAILALKV